MRALFSIITSSFLHNQTVHMFDWLATFLYISVSSTKYVQLHRSSCLFVSPQQDVCSIVSNNHGVAQFQHNKLLYLLTETTILINQ